MRKIVFYIPFLIYSYSFTREIYINSNDFGSQYRLLDRDLKEKSFQGLDEFLHNIFLSKETNPYSKTIAKTRHSSNLCEQELLYLKSRTSLNKIALEKLLDTKLENNQIPKIAFCFSGGGYRAMIATLGTLLAADELGLVDCATYISTLSGSTWALSSWLLHDLSLFDLKQQLRERVSNPIDHGFDVKLLVQNSISKLIYGQKLNLVGIWGALIANVLFKDFENKHKVEDKSRLSKYQIPRLSDLQKKLVDGKVVFPIYTAVHASKEYSWVEFTPYEIGNIANNLYIPSWSFGRKFNNGISTDYSPEFGIDYYLGIWGSAFTASITDLLHIYRDKIPKALYKTLDTVTGFGEHGIGELRLSPAKIKNFSYDLPNHQFTNNKNLILVDAGLDFNLPLPPLLRPEREVDLIIIGDASSQVEGAPELKACQEYAIRHNLKFPKVDYENIGRKTISVFKDNDPKVPVIIYMPRIANQIYSKDFDPTNSIKEGGFCSTFNLQYTNEQFDLLCGLTEYNMVENFKTIVEVIKNIIERKKN